jgi:uncharacterized Tic20 family protein
MTDNASAAPKPWGMELKSFLLLMHLSQLASFVVPLAGLVLPIVMWATNKQASPEVDAHGKSIINWIISLIIYSVISGILCLVIIGFFLLIAIGICSIVFCIIGGIKANAGTLWKYPMTISFIK